jgi:hypothetical protein
MAPDACLPRMQRNEWVPKMYFSVQNNSFRRQTPTSQSILKVRAAPVVEETI